MEICIEIFVTLKQKNLRESTIQFLCNCWSIFPTFFLIVVNQTMMSDSSLVWTVLLLLGCFIQSLLISKQYDSMNADH